VRVVVDVRPMQEPERSPLTAEYLEQLLSAFAAAPLDGDSFVLVSRTLRPDPSDALADAGLPISGRRRIPPTTRALRSAGLTLDSFLLRGAELRTAAGAGTGAADGGAVFHTAGGAVPIASGLPVVATLLDLAPWEMPAIYAASAAARFGHRLRARVLRGAARVIVCSRATAEAAARRLHLPAERLAVVPLAVSQDFLAAGRDATNVAATRDELGLPDRYIAFAGRYDARKDMRSLLEAVRGLAAPPFVVLAVDSHLQEDARLLRAAVDRQGVGAAVKVVETNGSRQRAAVIAGAQAFVYPALTDATGLPAIEALSLGVPVICTRAGALPETVGSAGIVVAPRDPARLAAALEAAWSTGALANQLRRQAQRRAQTATRTWSDVARETRVVYADAAETSSS
jgi:glycosyltransferase involved in cell wall biosynthesis